MIKFTIFITNKTLTFYEIGVFGGKGFFTSSTTIFSCLVRHVDNSCFLSSNSRNLPVLHVAWIYRRNRTEPALLPPILSPKTLTAPRRQFEGVVKTT